MTTRDPELERAIEAVLLASTEPVEATTLAQLLEVPRLRVEEACEALSADYAASRRGFVLARVAGGYRYQTHPELAEFVERFVLEGQQARLSGPALETLAIVAYKQPVSRAQLAAIRGVNVESVVNTLLERGYAEEVGRDPGPGNAVLYGTTRAFLEHLGLDSVAQLPPLHDFVPPPEMVETLEQTLLAGPSVEDDPGAQEGGSRPSRDWLPPGVRGVRRRRSRLGER
ncbi:MAG: SMC-Scp complex subunit ScpB [Actinobacteria bacterium]|nr:SMC-Scp complex subunit ScpB [Actinomycetota bacterium]